MEKVSKKKIDELEERMKYLSISDQDLLEKFITGSGPGGQKINKTSSSVYLKHLPSGIEVKCGKTRSRETNRFLARRELCEQIQKKKFGLKTLKEKFLDKIRKQKKRRNRRQRSQNPKTD
ncbi:MAG: peptide chain release factor-like protein [Chlamydiales bacterium]